MRFNPRGVVDALDGGQIKEGGMRALSDLVFDPTNPACFECRPAAIKQFDFTGITTPGAVSVAYVVGDICYGMISSGAVATYDQPFAYNLATNTLVTVTGTQTSATLPLTPATTGSWAPPQMALMGVLLIVTHPGFIGGGSAFFGWFDTTDPTSPVWYAGNTTTNLLPYVPTGVAQFNNRAWFILGNTLGFTDALTLAISDGTHFLTIGDSEPISGLASLPVTTTVQGIIQSLAVFKESIIALVNGDAITGDLAVNIISSSVGCVAPRTITPVPTGIMFESEDGIRTINQSGTLGDPNIDLKVPFIFSLDPTRDSASYNNNIYRITSQNAHTVGNLFQEWWYDFRMQAWTGPHSFTQDMSVPYQETFICFRNTLPATLWESDVVQGGTTTFVEDGNALNFNYQTAPMADDGGLVMQSAIQTVLDMRVPQQTQIYTCTASDSNNGVLSQALIYFNATGGLWNGVAFGPGAWIPVIYGLERYNIEWDQPLVFSRLVFQITGASAAGLKIGKLTVGTKPLGYAPMTVQQVPLPYVAPWSFPSGAPWVLDLVFPGLASTITTGVRYTFLQAVKIPIVGIYSSFDLTNSITTPPGPARVTASAYTGGENLFLLASSDGTTTPEYLAVAIQGTTDDLNLITNFGAGATGYFSARVSGNFITFQPGDVLYMNHVSGTASTISDIIVHLEGTYV